MPEKHLRTIGVCLTPAMDRQARALAASLDLGVSEWVRGLIEDALEKERARYRALEDIFGRDDP
ncbi:hypothetical protein [Candidatus Accumulibacter vicinus]|uniref:Ribbon-helix-helix protein CopG domain-containing protein n=1 Tax=Candidatus Accumulibacter vicinus TaxID=2954382 RepID=A0A084Y2D5_9PROT|nr:hypothetical protein [Candidatus Accumulibacter vicinus]KFB68879.1 MAG: hypothetical protein CAPSK01_001734 [Candidatus Accumulibacter vicinus]